MPLGITIVRSLYPIVNAFRYYYCTAALFENKAVFARFCVSGQEARSRRFWLHSAAGNLSAMWRSNRFVKIACLYEIDRPSGYKARSNSPKSMVRPRLESRSVKQPAAAAASSQQAGQPPPATQPCAPPPPAPRAPAGGIMATPLLFLMAP